MTSELSRTARDDARTVLRDVRRLWGGTRLSDALAALSQEKKVLVEHGDEDGAKEAWCVESAIEAHQQFVAAFSCIKRAEYYEGWCTLEQCELTLNRLARHFSQEFDELSLTLVRNLVQRWQDVFPYRWFVSPELVEKRVTCSVCGAVRKIRNNCGHVVGEIYRGESCFRRVEDCEVLSVSLVTDPVQKYSVCRMVGREGEEPRDMHNYAVVEFLAARLADPYHAWAFDKQTRRFPHSAFEGLDPESPCPCDSKSPYRSCCLTNPAGVLRPHIEFSFSVPPPAHLPSFAWSAPKRIDAREEPKVAPPPATS